MANIPVGTRNEEKLVVTSDVAIDFMGVEGARVLSTPNMILGLEKTARNLLVRLLDPGYDSVGTNVNVSHLAATPMGMTVTFRTEVTSVEDRRVNFKVEAFDAQDQIAEGTHQRAIVNVERFVAKMREKIQHARTA
ncbi:MAG: thioesterase [Acidobacteria bacterium]|nr:MAG: thioesterase [Acidobacteriota bacterium]